MKRKAVLFTAVLLISALSACGAPSGTDSEPSQTTAPAQERVLISQEQGGDYRIVRKDTAGNYALEESREILAAVEAATGHKLTLKTDWYQGDAGAVPQAHEILVGATNREESAAVEAEWRANGSRDWTVRLVGEKVLIYGGSESALSEATDYFIENFVRDGVLSMPENFLYTYEYAWPLNGIRIGDADITQYQIIVPDKCSAILLSAAEAVQAYIAENVGFTPEIIPDSHAAYVSDYEIVLGTTQRMPSLLFQGDCAYVAQLETRVFLGGTDDNAVYAAAQMFISGEAGETENAVYTLRNSTVKETADLLHSGVIEAMKYYVDARARLGREKHLTELMKYANEQDLGDVDVYGNCAVPVLYMPEDEVTTEQLAFANKVVRKVSGYLTTDIPPSKKDRLKGEVDFAANRLVRALYAPEGRVEPETADALKRFFLNDDFQSVYYSENHMLMFRAARYLAACYYEKEDFLQYRMTGAELRQQEHDYLVSFLQYRARRGWGEFDSMGYTIENFLSLINLYDCAPDEDLRTLAKMSLDTLLLNMICDSTENGMYGGAHGRSYDSVTTDMRCRFFWVYQLYFGEHSFDDVPAAAKDISISNTPFAFTSDYRPHDILYAIVAGKKYPFSNYEVAHNPATRFDPVDYGYISKYTYNTALYSIGCVNRQDPYPADSPDWKTEDTQQTNWSMLFAENSKATLTVHHPGKTSSHAYWYGDAECNCNHLFGSENVVTGIFFIPGSAGEYNYIHAYVPKAQFSEVIEQPEAGRIFVRLGDAYAVLRFSESYVWQENSHKELLIYDGTRRTNIRIAMACEAGDRETYGSFEAFVAAMEKKEMTFERDTLTLTYGNLKLSLDYSKKDGVTEHSFIDGVEQQYPYNCIYDSPYMKSELDSGVIEVYYGDTVRTMDFMNITDTTESRK